MLSLKKKTDTKLKNGGPQHDCIKQVISKPSNTAVLCYLALNQFFVRFFSEINLISIKIIILNDFFCDLEQVLRLI